MVISVHCYLSRSSHRAVNCTLVPRKVIKEMEWIVMMSMSVKKVLMNVQNQIANA